MGAGGKVRVLRSGTAFSYTCNACSRCCHDKVICIGPYEIARLAANLQISTTQLIAKHTEGGTVLRTRDDGGCGLLGPHGCSVHPDRPLVCRLYPLGRLVHSELAPHAQNEDLFVEVEPHSETEGVYGTDGTVSDYLASQQVQAYVDASQLYYDLYLELEQLLATQQDGNSVPPHAGEGRNDDAAASFIDIDPVLREYCAATGQPVPSDPDEKMHLHIRALRQRFSLDP